jgi:hypothetical protein
MLKYLYSIFILNKILIHNKIKYRMFDFPIFYIFFQVSQSFLFIQILFISYNYFTLNIFFLKFNNHLKKFLFFSSKITIN